MRKYHVQKNKNTQSGFTILVAVVTAGILMIIAMSIGGIALKEQVLSTANKESQVAFYAADTGMECALYWDQKKGVFAPTTNSDGGMSDPTGTPSINCNGSDNTTPNTTLPTLLDLPETGFNYTYAFQVNKIPVGDSGAKTCSVVMVSKNFTANLNQIKTHIQSYGYNTCAASLSRLERGVETTY